MDAKKSVKYGTEDLLRILQEGNRALALVGETDRMESLGELKKAFEAFKDKIPFQISILKPTSFEQFFALDRPSQSLFNQLASEISWWDLIDQIEKECFLNSSAIEKARPFLCKLWEKEKADDPFKPPADWKYLSVGEAVDADRAFYGFALEGSKTIKRAKGVKPQQDSEGILVCVKLTKLAQQLGLSGNPLEDTKEGWEAYAKVVNFLILKAGESHINAYPEDGFKNWREEQLTANRVRLTSASRKTWQILESQTEDDFVIAVAGADTGSLHAGCSVRRSRIAITFLGSQFPQDVVMVGQTVARQPDRLTKVEDLGIDCPGTKYAPDADGRFSHSLCFIWRGGGLHFGCGWADSASQHFGSAVGFLG